MKTAIIGLLTGVLLSGVLVGGIAVGGYFLFGPEPDLGKANACVWLKGNPDFKPKGYADQATDNQ